MAENGNKVLTIADDQKIAEIMVYTESWLCWGEVILKKPIRVSTWLRTNAAPDIVCVHNARVISPAINAKPTPQYFPDIHIAIEQILAFHLIPPAEDPLDYDPTEPNRRMDPISVLAGKFRFDAEMRFSSISNLTKYLERTREEFSSIYNAEISCPIMPAFGTVKVPFILVRQMTSLFSNR